MLFRSVKAEGPAFAAQIGMPVIHRFGGAPDENPQCGNGHRLAGSVRERQFQLVFSWITGRVQRPAQCLLGRHFRIESLAGHIAVMSLRPRKVDSAFHARPTFTAMMTPKKAMKIAGTCPPVSSRADFAALAMSAVLSFEYRIAGHAFGTRRFENRIPRCRRSPDRPASSDLDQARHFAGEKGSFKRSRANRGRALRMPAGPQTTRLSHSPPSGA